MNNWSYSDDDLLIGPLAFSFFTENGRYIYERPLSFEVSKSKIVYDVAYNAKSGDGNLFFKVVD